MKLYVKATSSYRSDLEDISVKESLKKQYKVDVRRKDDFIHAGLLGALRLRDKCNIQRDDALYLTSGFGNINILAKMNEYILENGEYIKLFDFINMLGNTTSFYVASELGIKAKSIFQISDNFTYFNTLISIYASLKKEGKEVVLGSLDITSLDNEIIKRVAGIEESSEVVSSVNYQKLSLDPEDALCSIEFDTNFYTLEQVEEVLLSNKRKVYCSFRCESFLCEKETLYSETEASYIINRAIERKKSLLYIDSYENRYKILRVESME